VPTYQYACTECDHAFEQFQSFSDDALTVCPQCAGRLRKVFNAVGVVFKGSGFYRNDSRSDGKPAAAKTSGSKDSTSDSNGSPDSSGDSSVGSSGDALPKQTAPAASGSSSSSGSDSTSAA
jgi:putative FmdB family regulatory protein